LVNPLKAEMHLKIHFLPKFHPHYIWQVVNTVQGDSDCLFWQ